MGFCFLLLKFYKAWLFSNLAMRSSKGGCVENSLAMAEPPEIPKAANSPSSFSVWLFRCSARRALAMFCELDKRAPPASAWNSRHLEKAQMMMEATKPKMICAINVPINEPMP